MPSPWRGGWLSLCFPPALPAKDDPVQSDLHLPPQLHVEESTTHNASEQE
jgi:hypothetical protein